MAYRRPGPREYFLSTRPYSLLNSVSRAVVGGVAAMATSTGFRPLPIFLTVLVAVGVAAFQAAENLLNDYFDTRHGFDSPEAPAATLRGHSIFTYGLSLREVRDLGLALLIAGSSMVIIATVVLPRPLLPGFLALGGVLLWGYNGRPLGLKYRGLGELDVFLAAIVMVVGGYYTVAGWLTLHIVILSVPVALLSSSVALADDIRDLEWDRAHGVDTLAVRAGAAGSRALYTIMVLLAVLLPIYLLGLPWGLLSLLSIPMVVPLVLSTWGLGFVSTASAVRLRFYLTIAFSAAYAAAIAATVR